MPDLIVGSLRGGMCDSDMPSSLADDQAALLLNVELYYSTLGERRLGCEPISLSGTDLTDSSDIVHLTEWFPQNDIAQPEPWILSATPITGAGVKFARLVAPFARLSIPGASWSPVTPADPALTVVPDVYQIQSQSLNGQLFFAYHSSVDRLHVWDGAQLRRTGLSPPLGAPVVVDEGTDTFVKTRWYRERFIVKAPTGDVILRRSESSDQTQFEPSGTGKGARVSRLPLVNEGETHWELEASSDGAFFFRIATIPIATLTYDDETDLATKSYNDLGPASETSGSYLLQPSAKFIAADADRLVLGSHWTDKTRQSRVMWTPVFADPGSGNSERIPLSTGGDNYVDLDNYEGGGLTGLSQVANGTFFAFKWSHIYKFTRTGDLTHAYDVLCLTKSRGAVPGSIFSGIDEAGRACIYFTDPSIGPCMLGVFGIRDIRGLKNTWKRFSYDPLGVPACGVYYPDKQQAHWWIATDGHSFPSLKFVLQVNELTSDGNGATRGWALADGTIATAKCAAIWHERTTDNQTTRLFARPFLGLPFPDYVQRSDVADTDALREYRAVIMTKPYTLAGLLNRWGSMTSALLASVHTTARLLVSCVRDYGLETTTVPTDLIPDDTGTFLTGTDQALIALPDPSVDLIRPPTVQYVVKQFDDLAMSEAVSLQYRFEDP